MFMIANLPSRMVSVCGKRKHLIDIKNSNGNEKTENHMSIYPTPHCTIVSFALIFSFVPAQLAMFVCLDRVANTWTRSAFFVHCW